MALPIGATILRVMEQSGRAQMWALVDPMADPEVRQFRLTATGFDVKGYPEGHHLEPVATFDIHDGDVIYHLLEVRKDASS